MSKIITTPALQNFLTCRSKYMQEKHTKLFCPPFPRFGPLKSLPFRIIGRHESPGPGNSQYNHSPNRRQSTLQVYGSPSNMSGAASISNVGRPFACASVFQQVVPKSQILRRVAREIKQCAVRRAEISVNEIARMHML